MAHDLQKRGRHATSQSRDGHLAQAARAVDQAVTTVLGDTDLSSAGALDRLAPFSRVLRFALADARVTASTDTRHA